MFAHWEKKHRQWLALGLLGGLILSLLIGLLLPLVSLYLANAEQIDKQQERLAKFQAIIASREQIIESSSQIQASLREAQWVSNQTSVPLVLADMQQKIRSTLTAANGELSSTQNLPEKNLDELRKVGVNIRFSGRMETLVKVVELIESARPVMVLENLKVLSVRGERNNRTGKIESLDKVHVSADVVTFVPNPS